MSLNFRQKLLLSFFIIFFTFIAVVFPFANIPIKILLKKALQHQTEAFSSKLSSMEDAEHMVQFLKRKEYSFFIRVTVMTEDGHVFYDSHAEKVLGDSYDSEFVTRHPVVALALEQGMAYKEAYSDLFEQKLAYTAIAFLSKQNQRFVVRTAYPVRYIEEMIGYFELGLIIITSMLLLAFSVMLWLMINYLSSPIQKVIQAISPYHEGKTQDITQIPLRSSEFEGEFRALAATFELLAERVKSQMQEIEKERNKRETVLESLTEGVLVVDGDNVINYANKAVTAMFGLAPHQLEDRSFAQLHEGALEKILLQARNQQDMLSEELRLRACPDAFFQVICVPIMPNNEMMLVLQDNTDYYKTIEMKKDFIANASHELKTPITIIRGYAETLNDYDSLPREVVKEATSKIIETSQRMNRLIRDLLLLSDSESVTNYTLEKTCLKKEVQRCVKELKPVYPEADFSLFLDEAKDYWVRADGELLRLAITNLLKNAVRYSEGIPKVKLILEEHSGKVSIKVQDEGVGIPEADQPYIFERFYTVNKSHSRKLGGSGLGLSITRAIIKKHRGQIEVTSELGKGTTFTVTLSTF